MAFGVISKDNKKPTRFFSKKQEVKIAEAVEGQRVPNSGATMWVKGDVLTEQFLLEAKTKTSNSDSISIKRDWFLKNKEEAAFMGKPHQAIVFNFGPEAPYNENHYIIDEYLFLELLEYLKTKK